MGKPSYLGFCTGHELHDHLKPHDIVRPYGTEMWLLEYTLRGRAVVQEPRGTFAVEPGDFLLIPAEVEQRYHMDAQVGYWEHYWVAFTPRASWHDTLLAWPRPAGYFGKLTITDIDLRARLADRFAQAVRFGYSPMRQREEFVLNIVEEILLWCGSVNPLSEEAQFDPRIRAALEYLCAHSSELLTVAHLADLCHLSPSRFAHLFRLQVGLTPMQYLEVQRIARARTLLAMTNAAVSSIGESCGFPTACYFTRIFKRHTGLTPTAYRLKQTVYCP